MRTVESSEPRNGEDLADKKMDMDRKYDEVIQR